MRAAEVRDSGRLVGATLEEFAVATRDVHQAIASRVFGLLAPLGPRIRPVQVGHDAVARAAYGSVRAGLRYAPLALGYGAALRADGRSVHHTRRGRIGVAKVNGILGSRVAEQAASLAGPLQLRTQDGPATRDPRQFWSVSGALSGEHSKITASGRVVVFVHGLCESDSCWELGAEQAWGSRGVSYGTKLSADAGWTPLYASYNTGLRISANGADLATLLEDVVTHWPAPVHEIALVGHSMGALVARSACQFAALGGHRWVESLRAVVLLGAPNLGAPLERVVNHGTHLLNRWPETRPFSELLNQRSHGIRDLRHGSLVEADWRDYDVDDRLDHCTEVPLVPQVDYFVVAATLTRSYESPFAPMLGDLLVQWTSATGQHPTRQIPFRPEGWFHVGRANHLDLLNRPAVYDQLLHWLR